MDAQKENASSLLNESIQTHTHIQEESNTHTHTPAGPTRKQIRQNAELKTAEPTYAILNRLCAEK